MHTMIQKFVDQKFMTEKEGQYLENAVENGDSIIIAGHRSAGTRNFIAATMAVAKGKYKTAQVKSMDDVAKECEYLLIPGVPGVDFEQLMEEVLKQKDKAFITIKEPEHPFSIMKIAKNAYKATGDTSKVIHMFECNKENDVPFVTKVTKMSFDEKGKMLKEDLE